MCKIHWCILHLLFEGLRLGFELEFELPALGFGIVLEQGCEKCRLPVVSGI